MATKAQPRKPKMIRPMLGRDLEMAKEHLPTQLGGEGLTVPEIAEKHGVSTWAVYKAMEQQDVKEVHTAWLKWAMREHRKLGPTALRATKQLLEAGEPSTVRDFWRRTGVSLEPTVEVDARELRMEIKIQYPEMFDIQPEYAAAAERGEAIPISAVSLKMDRAHGSSNSYNCPNPAASSAQKTSASWATTS